MLIPTFPCSAGFSSGKIKVIIISSMKQTLILQHSQQEDSTNDEENTMSVESIAFSPENFKWLASGGMNKQLTVWGISTGSRRIDCVHEDGVVALSWHPSLPLVCSGSLDFRLRIWDARNGFCYRVLSGHQDFILSISLVINVENGLGTLVSVSDDQKAKVFIVDFPALVSQQS
jgi:WD40 repeat protein